MISQKFLGKVASFFLSLVMVGLGTLEATAKERVIHYHNDLIGSPVAATDAQGALLWREEYTPYGQRLIKEDAGGNSRWFTGHTEVPGLAASYFMARWYDPELGRFLSMDPAEHSYEDVHLFNRYAYANNSPYRYTDPDGHLPMLVPAVMVAARLAAGYIAKKAAQRAAQRLAMREAREQVKASSQRTGGKEVAEKISQEFPENLIPTQSRSEMSGSVINRLAKDMKQNGYDQSKPVSAWRNPLGRLEIQDGHHRTAAAKKAGIRKIPVKVVE